MKTYTNNISDQDLAMLEETIRLQRLCFSKLEKENDDIKTAIVDLMERYAV